jgi:hypothetical protein
MVPMISRLPQKYSDNMRVRCACRLADSGAYPPDALVRRPNAVVSSAARACRSVLVAA